LAQELAERNRQAAEQAERDRIAAEQASTMGAQPTGNLAEAASTATDAISGVSPKVVDPTEETGGVGGGVITFDEMFPSDEPVTDGTPEVEAGLDFLPPTMEEAQGTIGMTDEEREERERAGQQIADDAAQAERDRIAAEQEILTQPVADPTPEGDNVTQVFDDSRESLPGPPDTEDRIPAPQAYEISRSFTYRNGNPYELVTYSDGNTSLIPYKGPTPEAPPEIDTGGTTEPTQPYVDAGPDVEAYQEIMQAPTTITTPVDTTPTTAEIEAEMEKTLGTTPISVPAEPSPEEAVDTAPTAPSLDEQYNQAFAATIKQYPKLADLTAQSEFFKFADYYDEIGGGDISTAVATYLGQLNQTKEEQDAETARIDKFNADVEALKNIVRADPLNRNAFDPNTLDPQVLRAITEWYAGDEFAQIQRDAIEAQQSATLGTTVVTEPTTQETVTTEEVVTPSPIDAMFASLDTATTQDDVRNAYNAYIQAGGTVPPGLTEEQYLDQLMNDFVEAEQEKTMGAGTVTAPEDVVEPTLDAEDLADVPTVVEAEEPTVIEEPTVVEEEPPVVVEEPPVIEEEPEFTPEESDAITGGADPDDVIDARDDEEVVVEDPEPAITQEFLSNLTTEVQSVIDDLGFDSENFEREQLDAIEADYEESRQRLGRQFGIDPGGPKTGRAARTFQLLEADRIQKRAAIRRDVADRTERALQQQLEGLTRVFQIAADTDLAQQKINANNAQFQETLAIELEKLGLNDIQVTAAVKKINADIANQTRRTSAEISQAWSAITGKVGTESGTLSAEDLGIDLEAEDIIGGILPMGESAKRQLLAQSFEAATGRVPTASELNSLLGGGKVKVESLPTLEVRKLAADITQQNMERFRKYASIAEENGLRRDQFDEAKKIDDRNWALTTGDVASQYGLSQDTFAQAQYLVDKYANALFFDDSLTPAERDASISEYRDEIAQQFFPSTQINFIQASSLFERTIGNQQRSTALQFGMNAESYARANRQAEQAESRFQDTWASLIAGQDRVDVEARSLKGVGVGPENLDYNEKVTDIYNQAFAPALRQALDTASVDVGEAGSFDEFFRGADIAAAGLQELTDDQIRRAADDFVLSESEDYNKFKAAMDRDYGRSIIIDDEAVKERFISVVTRSRDQLAKTDYDNFLSAITEDDKSREVVYNTWKDFDGISTTWWKDLGPEQRQSVMAMLGFATAGGGQQQSGGVWSVVGDIVGIAYGAYQGYKAAKDVTGG
jgi:hypothetical protein